MCLKSWGTRKLRLVHELGIRARRRHGIGSEYAIQEMDHISRKALTLRWSLPSSRPGGRLCRNGGGDHAALPLSYRFLRRKYG
jgi:hypothetical protein